MARLATPFLSKASAVASCSLEIRSMSRKSRAGLRPAPHTRGFTLVEMMIALTLVAAIITGLLMAMRTGLTAYERVKARLEDNRRVMGLDQTLHRQFGGMMPVMGECGAG